MSFHLVLSFMTFLLEYTFICSNSLHRKSPVLFGNWLWLHQAKMSHYLPVLQKGWFFYFCDYWTFRVWNPWFQVPECSNHSKLNQFCHFSHFTVISDIWNDKMSNFCCIHPFHSLHHLKIQRWHLPSLITIKCLEMSPKCHFLQITGWYSWIISGTFS